MLVPVSVGFSKSGADLKVSAPVEESILNLEASAPPFKDQVTVLSAENVWIEDEFSLIDLELEFAPEPPEGPVIFGAFSSTSEIFTVRFWSEVFPAESVALIFTS